MNSTFSPAPVAGATTTEVGPVTMRNPDTVHGADESFSRRDTSACLAAPSTTPLTLVLEVEAHRVESNAIRRHNAGAQTAGMRDQPARLRPCTQRRGYAGAAAIDLAE